MHSVMDKSENSDRNNVRNICQGAIQWIHGAKIMVTNGPCGAVSFTGLVCLSRSAEMFRIIVKSQVMTHGSAPIRLLMTTSSAEIDQVISQILTSGKISSFNISHNHRNVPSGQPTAWLLAPSSAHDTLYDQTFNRN